MKQADERFSRVHRADAIDTAQRFRRASARLLKQGRQINGMIKNVNIGNLIGPLSPCESWMLWSCQDCGGELARLRRRRKNELDRSGDFARIVGLFKTPTKIMKHSDGIVTGFKE